MAFSDRVGKQIDLPRFRIEIIDKRLFAHTPKERRVFPKVARSNSITISGKTENASAGFANDEMLILMKNILTAKNVPPLSEITLPSD